MAEVRPGCNGGLCRLPRTRRRRHLGASTQYLARALNGDEFVALGHPDRDRPGDLLPLDLAEGGGLREFARAAVGGRDRGSAAGSRRQATVDAISVRIVGDDENAI